MSPNNIPVHDLIVGLTLAFIACFSPPNVYLLTDNVSHCISDSREKHFDAFFKVLGKVQKKYYYAMQQRYFMLTSGENNKVGLRCLIVGVGARQHS